MQLIKPNRIGSLVVKMVASKLLITIQYSKNKWALPAIYINQSLLTKNLVAKVKIQLKCYLDNVKKAFFFDILINNQLIFKKS